MTGGHTNWSELKYTYTVENYGRSTAENVEVYLDLNYFKGQMGRIKELPPGESFDFVFNAWEELSGEHCAEVIELVTMLKEMS